jgi:hypothetical protein
MPLEMIGNISPNCHGITQYLSNAAKQILNCDISVNFIFAASPLKPNYLHGRIRIVHCGESALSGSKI